MKRRTLLISAAAALALLAGGWYWGSPWYSLWRMREAARAGDLAGLSAYVDTRALVDDAIGGDGGMLGSIAALKGADRAALRDLVDLARRKLEKPDVTSRIGRIRPLLAALPGGLAGLAGGSDSNQRHPYVRHQGLDRFELRYREGSEESGPVLGFRRVGLGWKLDRIRFGEE